MKRYIISLALVATCAALFAVPAKRGFHPCTLQDGTTVSLTLAGDEFAHWYESADGTVYDLNDDGTFAPAELTRANMDARRKASPRRQAAQQRRAKNDVGAINLAPRGILILANYTDVAFKATNTQADLDSMMNGKNYTYGGTYASAREYFIAQSGGQYQPVFDVYGPVTVQHNQAYYGKNDSEGNDMYPCDLIVEACKAVDSQYDVDFSLYDNDGDGYIDFVYVIYAGKGEADGGAKNTIWPHNWNVQAGLQYGGLSYSKSETKVDGLYIDNYACSGELNGSTGNRNSIGTICHEFGHVLGLPDFYDTNYGTNYNQGYTPNEWDIMDGGSYNGANTDGTCPPNYSAWEKAFFGWITPVNLGATAQSLTLHASGTEGYVAYQVNASGNYQAPTSSGQCYYIENRQQQGWDTYLPGHGMLVWSVNYSQSAWDNNEPNNTSGSPKYTVISASGSKRNIGTGADPFPGTRNKTTWNTIAAKPIQNIVEANGTITADYISTGGDDPVDPQTGMDINLNFTTLIAELDGDVMLLTLFTADYDETAATGSQLELLLTAKTRNSIIGTFLPGEGDMMLGFNGNTIPVMPSQSALTITRESNGYTFSYWFRADETGDKEGSFTITDAHITALDGLGYDITLGTNATGISVTEAKAIIDALGHNDETTMHYFVRGYISTMRNTAEQIAQYKTARFNISDDGTAIDELYSYNTKWLNNTNFTTGNEVKKGDLVIVYGVLQNYQQKNGTYEKEIKGYIYQLNPQEDGETATETIETGSLPVKMLVNGQLIIRRGQNEYNILGVEK